jgi:uncharacterized protein (DUF2147 family)
MKKTTIILVVLTLFFLQNLVAQSPIGIWKTIDDETGQPKSYLEIYESGGKLEGKIVKLLQKPADSVCEKCPGERKNKPVIGMVIVENMSPKNGLWKGGKILDPEKGKWYSCEFWLKEGDSNQLEVRGYIAFFYRTQTWYRVN